MAKLSLFTYHVILHPEDAKKGEKQKDSQLIIEPKTVLAKDQNSLAFKVTREIPEKYVDSFDRIEIGIAPFNKRSSKKTDTRLKTKGPSVESATISNGLNEFLTEDGTWQIKTGTTQYENMSVPATFTTSGSVPGNYYSAAAITEENANV